MTLIKKRTVLTLDGSAAFKDEDGKVYVDLDNDVWFEMGEPDEITVTIEPGDTLNG